MFTKFNHQTLRRYTIAFGQLFSNINISKYDSDSTTIIKNIEVPIHQSSGDYAVNRAIQAPLEGEEGEAAVKYTLPLIAYEMTSLAFDSLRNTHKNIKVPVGDFTGAGDTTARDYMFNRVPYIFDFNMTVAADLTNDVNQIIEQIVPYFQPTLTISVHDVINRQTHIKTDTVITLDGITKNDTWEDQPDSPRVAAYDLAFSVKGYLYMPVKNLQDIIVTVEVNYGVDPDDPENLILDESDLIDTP